MTAEVTMQIHLTGGTHSDAEVAELRSKIDSLTLQVAVASGRAAHVEDAPMW